jgi:hypothetical protein
MISWWRSVLSSCSANGWDGFCGSLLHSSTFLGGWPRGSRGEGERS